MSNSAIDQILQITRPVRTAIEPVLPTASDRPAFQKHLERATTETLPSENTDSTDTDHEDLVASDKQHDATNSREDATLNDAESAAAGDEDLELEVKQDAVEISDAAIVLDGIEDSTENEVVIAQELPQPTDTDSENPDSEERAEQALSTKIENFDESESAEKSAVPTEPKSKPISTGLQKKVDEKTTRSDEPAEDLEAQPKVASNTQQELTGEPVVDAQKKSKTPAESVQETQAEQTATKEQPVQRPVQTKGPGVDSSTDRKKAKQDKNPQTTATVSPTVPDEPSVLATENRPTVSGSTPPPESTSPTAPTPTNLGSEATNVASRSGNISATTTPETPPEAEPVPTADRARFVNRVGGAIRAAQNRDGEIRLQLRPAELGSLRIEIAVKQGVLTAHLEAETSAARTILLDNLPALRERLAEQEIRIEKFDVDVRDEGRQQPDNPGTEDRKSNLPQQESGAQRQNKDQTKQTMQPAPDVVTSSTHIGSLDVSI